MATLQPKPTMPADPLIDSPRAWVSTVAASVANGMGFGIAYTFGTFFDSMATEFNADKGSTALIFGVTLLFFFGFGLVAGPLSDQLGPRPLLMLGGFTMVFGLWVTARADSLVVAIVAYGIGVGIGGGLYIAPLSASVGRMFDRHRPAAFSVVAVGNGAAVLILVPLSERIIARQGWRDAYVTLALIAAVVFIVCSAAIVSRPGPGGQSGPTARDLAANPGFAVLFTVSLLMSVGLFIAFAFIQTFAVEDGVSVEGAARLVSVVGLSSIFGRIGLTALVKPLGALAVIRLALAIQTVAYVLWYFAGGTIALLVVFVILFGSAYGGFVAVVPEAATRIVGLAGLGRAMGLQFFAFGVGGLIGPPLAGWLADRTTGNDVPILLTVGLLATATLTLEVTRVTGRLGDQGMG